MAMDTGGMMASGGSAAFANPPISNYKGVMLCDRPSADIGSSKPAPFNSAVVPPTQLGLNPAKKVNVYSTQNKPKGAAVSKRWLPRAPWQQLHTSLPLVTLPWP